MGVKPCSLLKVRKAVLATCFLLDLFSDHEDGGDMFFRNAVLILTTRLYILEDRTLQEII
jgi:hypothetical protein